MKTRYKIIIGFVIFLVISAGLLSIWIDKRNREMYENTFRSDIDYDVRIVTDAVLQNVTLYIPLPAHNNTSAVGRNIIDTNFNEDDLSWKYALVDNEHGLMLSLKNNEVKPPTRLYFSADLGTMVSVDHELNTKDPIGNEMVLSPKYEVTPVDAGKYWYFDDVYTYKSMVYAEYATIPDANVEISISLDGRNSWWTGGWQSNDYAEQIDIQLSGPQDGWTTVYGEMVAGEGVYKEY
ncbi:MAG: hypothetical protein SCH66_10630 [Methanolobus sp.]|nr:hypothetical protein [Methanolobus sp.]